MEAPTRNNQNLATGNFGATPFYSIPDELTEIILNYLPVKDQLNAEQVCSKWKKLLINGTVTARYFEGGIYPEYDSTITIYSKIHIPFYDIVISQGQGFCMNEDDLDGLGFLQYKTNKSFEGQVPKELAISVFKKIAMDEKIRHQKCESKRTIETKIVEGLKSYWERDFGMKDNVFGFFTWALNTLSTINWWEKEETLDAFLYQRSNYQKDPCRGFIHYHGMMNEIFIPSKEKILNSAGFVFDSKEPRNKYYNRDSELEIVATLVPIKFPISILELLDQKNKIEENIKHYNKKQKSEIKKDFKTIKNLIKMNNESHKDRLEGLCRVYMPSVSRWVFP